MTTKKVRRYNTVYGKSSVGENFHGFCNFSLDRESFPVKYGLVYQQFKSTELLQQTLYHEQLFSTQNTKAFPHRCFPVYGNCIILLAILLMGKNIDALQKFGLGICNVHMHEFEMCPIL